jgi:O-antigen/teichoic acid export membrane protein
MSIFITLKEHRLFPKITNWLKLITFTGGAQLIIQLLGLISGILIIRLMPVKEYAWYTIANTMLGTLTILSDGGISTGVLSEGGKVWNDKKKLSEVLATGMQLRKIFAVGSLVISIPILAYLLSHQGASWGAIVIICFSLMPAFYAALSDTLLEIPLKLHQTIKILQQNQVGTALGRIILMVSTLFFFPFTSIALLGNGIPRIIANIRLRKANKAIIDDNISINNEVKDRILKLVYRILPGSIYYCVSGQITVWLLSLFGSTVSIGQIGGLGRIAVVLTVFSNVLNTLIVPRFAKKENILEDLRSLFVKIQIFVIVFAFTLLLFFYFFTVPALWILGDNFKGLQFEFLLSMAGSCIGLMAGISFSLYTSKGWALNPIFSIPLNVFSILLGIMIFKPHSLVSALWFSCFVNTIQYFINTFYCFYMINRLKIKVDE